MFNTLSCTNINEDYTHVELHVCEYCCDQNEVTHLQCVDEVNLNQHPTYKFIHDNYTIFFYFTKSYECKDSCWKDNCGFDKTLKQIIHNIRVKRPYDKETYNVDTLINKKFDIFFDDYKIDDLFYDALNNNELTDEIRDVANASLSRSYEKHLDRYNKFLMLETEVLNIYDVNKECYNMMYLDSYTTNLLIYIEKDCDVWYFQDCELQQLKFECNDDAKYGYELCDVFTLPHFLEHDNVEYVRYDANIKTQFIFTQGKILCSVHHINKNEN